MPNPMADSGQAGELARTEPSPGPEAANPRLAAWRQEGADRLDSVAFCFIAALARRAQALQGEARRLLEARLAKALDDYAARLEQARQAAVETVTRAAAGHPEAAEALAGLLAANDFSGLARFVAALERPPASHPLAGLVAYLAQQGAAEQESGLPDATEAVITDVAVVADGAAVPGVAPPAELKSLRYFRSTWSKLSVEQQLSQALAQVPENAGPLNPHLLVLRSLQGMRDISPDYLNRFMSYVDTLLWLDQANSVNVPAKKTPAARTAKG